MPAPDCAAMTAFSFPPFGRLRPRHQTRPPGSKPARHACPASPSLRAPPRPGRPQHGTALLEFTLAAAVLLPAALLAAEAATWQTVRQTVQLALMEAARAGAVSHAAPARMKAVFVQALRPLHGGDASRQARALREAALLADAHPWRIEVLRPDARDFRLHARPGLRIAPAPGLPAIDNDYQDLQHARRAPGQATDIFQANTLSLRLTYLHKPLSARCGRCWSRWRVARRRRQHARARLSLLAWRPTTRVGTPARRWRAPAADRGGTGHGDALASGRLVALATMARGHGVGSLPQAALRMTPRPVRDVSPGAAMVRERSVTRARTGLAGGGPAPATLPRRQPAWPARPSRRGPAWRRAWRPPRWPAMRARRRRGVLRQDMHEDLAFPHHAQLAARTFLDSAGAPSRSRTSASSAALRARRPSLVFLRRHLALQIPDLEPAALTHPQRVLDQA